MHFRYQLRTPLIVLTTVACTVGINLGFFKLTGSDALLDGWLGAGLSIGIWIEVPFAVVCVLGVKWVLERNRTKAATDWFVLSAICINLAWNILVHPLLFYALRVSDSDTSSLFFLQNLISFASGLVSALCWLLMILAHLLSNSAKVCCDIQTDPEAVSKRTRTDDEED